MLERSAKYRSCTPTDWDFGISVYRPVALASGSGINPEFLTAWCSSLLVADQSGPCLPHAKIGTESRNGNTHRCENSCTSSFYSEETLIISFLAQLDREQRSIGLHKDRPAPVNSFCIVQFFSSCWDILFSDGTSQPEDFECYLYLLESLQQT